MTPPPIKASDILNSKMMAELDKQSGTTVTTSSSEEPSAAKGINISVTKTYTNGSTKMDTTVTLCKEMSSEELAGYLHVLGYCERKGIVQKLRELF
jgi:hypothetical protein